MNYGEVFKFIVDRQPGMYLNLPYKNGTWVNNSWFTDTEEALNYTEDIKLDADVYFGVIKYNIRARKKENAQNSVFLWADLDTCTLEEIPAEIQPTIAVETSPGRLHGYWQVDREMKPTEYERLNKLIAYGLAPYGADKSGYDITQVLRVPGSLNHKYDTPKPVTVVCFEDRCYSVDFLQGWLEQHYAIDEAMSKNAILFTEEHFKTVYKNLPNDVRQKLFKESPNEYDDKSAVVYWAMHRIIEVGLGAVVAVEVILRSNWNKFAGRADEYERLEEIANQAKRKEIDRVIEELPVVYDTDSIDNSVIEYQEFRSLVLPPIEWTVEGFIPKGGLIFIAAEEKSFKSTIALDLAYSMAKGLPFLNLLPVKEASNVLYISFEGALNTLQFRLNQISSSKVSKEEVQELESGGYSIFFNNTVKPKKLQLYMSTNYYKLYGKELNLSTDEGKAWLDEQLTRLSIDTVIVDPLYVALAGVDLSSASEVDPHIGYFKGLMTRELVREVIIVHHQSKSSKEKAESSRMYGSGTLLYAYDTLLSITNMSKDVKKKPREDIEYSIGGTTDATEQHVEYILGAKLEISAIQRAFSNTDKLRFMLYIQDEQGRYKVVKDGNVAKPLETKRGKRAIATFKKKSNIE